MMDYTAKLGQEAPVLIAFPSPHGGCYVAGFAPDPNIQPGWRNTTVMLWRAEANDPDTAMDDFHAKRAFAMAAFRVGLYTAPTPEHMISVVTRYLNLEEFYT